MPDEFMELNGRLTDTARVSLEQAKKIAHASGSPYVGTEHLLLGILSQSSSLGAQILVKSGVTFDRTELALNLTPQSLVVVATYKGVSQEVLQTVRTAWALAVEFGQDFIGTEHLVYSVLDQSKARATRLLRDMNININSLRDDLEEVFSRQQQESLTEPRSPKLSNLKIIEKFGVDLTQRATDGLLDPVIGRDKEVSRLVTILGRRSKNNPALIGEPGVGKTAVAEGLAQRMVSGDVPSFLTGKRLIQLDLMSILAGTKYRGQFEERMQKLLRALKKHPEIIIFIDELHLLVGAGAAEGSIDAANVLKPALARGEVRVVGATTFDEYRKHIEKDSALARRFQTVVVDEPTVEETVRIVSGLRGKMSQHHRVELDDDVVRLAVELAERYVADRRFPDKAIDVIDEASALLRSSQKVDRSRRRQRQQQIQKLARQIDLAVENRDYERAAMLKSRMLQLEKQTLSSLDKEQALPKLTEADVRKAVAVMTNVPLAHINQDQMKSLAKLEARLNRQIIGQEQVIGEVVRVVKRARSGLAPTGRPLGSFIFLGPTGVGKTELARVLAREVFGGDKSLIKIDMSEFGEKHTTSRLLGAPAGYIGYDDGGKLTDTVRHQPYSVVLFDEIEKAHPDVLNILLQLLEDGQLTDAKGRVVSFRQTIIVLTSNVGADKMVREAELGFQTVGGRTDQQLTDSRKRNSQSARRALEQIMRPELMGRFDAILTFDVLTKKAVSKIFNNLVKETKEAVEAQQRQLKILPSAKRILISHGYDEKRGVRPLRRVIERELTSLVADALISGDSQPGDTLEVGSKKGEVVVNVRKD